MALSQKNHKIKHRENPNDVFITPLALAKTHIDMIKTKKIGVGMTHLKIVVHIIINFQLKIKNGVKY